MADKQLTIIVKLQDLATRALSGLKAGLQGFTKVLGSIRAGFLNLATVAAIPAAAAASLAKLTERGGQVIGVQRAFARATGDVTASLTSMRAATGGLISNLDLMQQFNRAITLGSAETVDQFNELSKTAITLGRALGVDTTFALESLNLGIARQSRLILDNLGLIVSVEQANKDYAKSLNTTADKLDDNQKREAFRIAALARAREAIEELGGIQETAADSLTRLTTSIRNLVDRLAQLIALSPGLRQFFGDLALPFEALAVAAERDSATVAQAFALVGRTAGQAFLAGVSATIRLGFEGLARAAAPLPAAVGAPMVAAATAAAKAFEGLEGAATRALRNTLGELGRFRDGIRETIEAERHLEDRIIAEKVAAGQRLNLLERARAVQLGLVERRPDEEDPAERAARAQKAAEAFDKRIKGLAEEAQLLTEAVEQGVRREQSLERARQLHAEIARLLQTQLSLAHELQLTEAARRLGPLVPGGAVGVAPQIPRELTAPGVQAASSANVLDRIANDAIASTNKMFDTWAEGTIRNIDAAEAARAQQEFMAESVIASVSAMTQIVIGGTQQIGAAFTNLIANILRSLPGVGGPLGALIGGVGGIVAGLFAGRGNREPVPVRLATVDRRAAQEMQRREGPDRVVFQVVTTSGELVREIEYELGRRERRDAVVRIPRGAGGF